MVCGSRISVLSSRLPFALSRFRAGSVPLLVLGDGAAFPFWATARAWLICMRPQRSVRSNRRPSSSPVSGRPSATDARYASRAAAWRCATVHSSPFGVVTSCARLTARLPIARRNGRLLCRTRSSTSGEP